MIDGVRDPVGDEVTQSDFSITSRDNIVLDQEN